MKKIRLLGICHSGRKGIRGSDICDRNYEGIISHTCTFRLEDIQQFKS